MIISFCGFQDGIYVEKAVQLKEKLGVVLTKTQKGILEDVRKRKGRYRGN